MSTQVGIGKSIHRNPKIAASEAVDMALKTGSIEKADFVFVFSSVGYDQKTIVKCVYDLFGRAPLSSCSGEGTIAGWESYESNFSVAVMAIRSDELRFTNGMTGLKSNSAEARQDQATNDKKETEPRGHSSAGRKRAMIKNNRNAKSGQRELNKGY